MTAPLLALIVEITHRCPLHCVYCSNPREMNSRSKELPAEAWKSVFEQAADMGVLQVDFTGGEPLARSDLTELVRLARKSKLYVNLITSGIGLHEARLDELIGAGLDHIQLSFQGSRAELANEISGAKAHTLKVELARQIRNRSVAFTINVVVHRRNLDHLEEIIALAEELGASRLEIAHAQYYGWAFTNREALLPMRHQLIRSVELVEAARERLKGKMRIDFVVPDYYGKYPKACMGGWGQRLMLLNPSGEALPCHAAGVIPGMRFEKVTERPLKWIWEESAAFCKFRGEDWMPDPCRSCDRRSQDFGGCRCQAFVLAGDANVTDPVCSLAPAHHLVTSLVKSVNSNVDAPAALVQPEWIYRPNPA